ncbi:hypothetical protein M8J75_001488 [Diaphorina citri]|nr:hypothetical protein M8J75_001488 [Diaphorina citri]
MTDGVERFVFWREFPSRILSPVANELQIKGLIQKPSSVTPDVTSNITSSNSSNNTQQNSSNHHNSSTSSNPHSSSSPARSSSEVEDEDVDMEEKTRPVVSKVDVSPSTPITPITSTAPTEQTFRNVTQYGGGMIKPGDVSPAGSPKASNEDKDHYEEHMIIAPDGEVIQPLNHNNNNGQIKSSSQSTYIGHCLEESLNQADLQCRICKRFFNNRQNLRRHVQTHTGDKPHQCDICFISFLRLSHLQRHIRTHTGEKPYACSLCAKSFSRSDKLKNHYIHQHSEVGAELTNKKRGRPSKLNFPGYGFQLSNNTLTLNNNSSGQNENTSPPPSSHPLSHPSLEDLARNHSPSLFFNSGALSLTPVSMNGNSGINETALSLIVNKTLQNQAYQHIANAINENVLSIAPIKVESNVQEQVAS